MTTIEELEAALKDVNLTVQKNFDGCDGYGREHVEDFLLAHHTSVKEALTQAIAIKKGECVVVPREYANIVETTLETLDAEIKARFKCHDRSEEDCGRGSYIYALLSVPRNMLRTAKAMIAAQEEK